MALVDSINAMFNMAISVEHVFSVDICPIKRLFIKTALKTKPNYISEDVRMFLNNQFIDADGRNVELADLQIDVLLAGWSCKDVSALNNNRASFRDN